MQNRNNPGWGERFWTYPVRPRGPPSLLWDGYRVSFPGVKRPGRGVNHPSSSSAEVKERVELYVYLPSVPNWHVTGCLYLDTQRVSKRRVWVSTRFFSGLCLNVDLYTEFNQAAFHCGLVTFRPSLFRDVMRRRLTDKLYRNVGDRLPTYVT